MASRFGFVTLLAAGAACAGQQTATQSATSPIERGRYLVAIGGCNDCHTPKVLTSGGLELDTARLLSGHRATEPPPAIPKGAITPTGWAALTTGDGTAWAGPWGVSFAVNLTPDVSGLGAWTPETFIKAMRTGKHLGNGRPILPPMPWYGLGQLTDDDLQAVFAYLRSLKPVSNVVPAPIPPTGAEPGRGP
jgi:mono/diheme cytochrome c family protein